MLEMMNATRVVLAHPHPAPFVQQVGKALFDAGMLSRFATTFADRSDLAWRNAMCHGAKFFNFNLERQLQRRSITEFPLSLVMNYPWWEIVRTLVGRLDKDKRLTDIVFHYGNTGFDRWVANRALVGTNCVYGYEYASLATLQAAQKHGIARIYDVPSPEHDFVESLLQQEIDRYPELRTSYRKYVKARQECRTQRRRQEWQLADVVIANSEFTKASYAKSGLDISKVRVVPYGAPPVCQSAISGGTAEQEPMRFLWAGTFSIRKGAHYLLDAWKHWQAKMDARLDVYGAMGLPSCLLQELPDSIHISGTVTRSELYTHYRNADVLVFPTLCDGFGMVVTEAFAQGLPVITTDRAGAADLVRHGVNGLIVPSGDASALTEALDWCITHRKEVKAMRQAALETAASWQWSDYRRVLIENIRDGLQAAGYAV